jgi:ribonuclease D
MPYEICLLALRFSPPYHTRDSMQFEKEIDKQSINELPLSGYEGEIILLETEEAIEAAAKKLSQSSLIGIDTETKPNFRKGQMNKVALIQLALVDVVYLLQLKRFGMPASISDILENPEIKKIGIATAQDVKELRRDYPPCSVAGVVDLNKLSKSMGFKSAGARKLTALILGFRISKRQQMSNWEQKVLTPAQRRYAATDAWVCLEMYKRLKTEKG